MILSSYYHITVQHNFKHIVMDMYEIVILDMSYKNINIKKIQNVNREFQFRYVKINVI